MEFMNMKNIKNTIKKFKKQQKGYHEHNIPKYFILKTNRVTI